MNQQNQQAKILANGIFQLIADKPAAAGKKLVDNFLRYLANKRLVNLVPKILQELAALHLIKNETILVTVESRNELSKTAADDIKKMLSKKLGRKIILKTELKPALLGGVVIKYNDQMIDLSLKRQLANLNKQLISHS